MSHFPIIKMTLKLVLLFQPMNKESTAMGIYVICSVILLLLRQDSITALTINGKTSTDIDSDVGLLLKENEILRNCTKRLEQLENRVDIIEESTNQLLELNKHANASTSKRSGISFQNSQLPVSPEENSDSRQVLRV